MAATDARPVPRKGVAFRLYFAYRDDANDLVTGWSGKTPVASLSGDTTAFTTSATYIGTPTEIATNTGAGYVDITALGMNYDAVVIKCTLTGANDVVIILYPEEGGDYRVDVVQIDGNAVSLTTAADVADAVWDESISAHRTADTTGLALITASGNLIGGDWSTHSAANVYTEFTTGANLTSVGLSTASINLIADQVWNELTTGHTTTGTFGEQVKTDIDSILYDTATTLNGKIDTIDANIDTLIIGVNVAQVNGATVNLLAASGIADAVWDEPQSSHTVAGTAGVQMWTDIDAILQDTDSTIPTTLTTIDNLVDDLESRLTAVRAGYLDNLNGHTPQTGDSYAVVTNGVYGLSVIENLVDGVESTLDSATYGLAALNADLDTLIAGVNVASINGAAATIYTDGDIADAVWDETVGDHRNAGSTGLALITASGNLIGGGSVLTSSDIADAVWDEAIADHLGGDKAGQWAVWGSGLNWNMTYDAADQALTDYDVAKGSEVATAAQIWAYSCSNLVSPNSTGMALGLLASGILDVNTISISGVLTDDILRVNMVKISGEWVALTDANDIADAVWNESIVDHAAPGSTGHALVVASGNLISGDWSSSDATALNQTTIITHLTEIKGGTWSSSTDTLEHIYNKAIDIEIDTQYLQTQVGLDGAGLTNMPWNSAWDAEVQSEVTDALVASGIARSIDLQPAVTAAITAYDIPTNTQLEARTLPTADYFNPTTDAVSNVTNTTNLTNLPTMPTDWITSAGLSAAAVTEIEDGVWTRTSRQLSGTINDFDELNTTLNSAHGAGSWTDTLIASGDIAQAVWEFGGSRALTTQNWSTHDAAGVVTALGTGSSLTAVGLSATALSNINSQVDTALSDYDSPTKAEMDTSIISVSGVITNIHGDTTTLITGVNVTSINGVAATLYTDEDVADAVWNETLADHVVAGSTGHALVVASGNLISGNWGDATAANQVTINSKLDTIDNYIDSEVAAIKAKTDQLTFSGTDVYASLQGETVTVGTINTNVITATSLDTSAVNEIVDQVWNEVVGDHRSDGSTGLALITASGNLIGSSTLSTTDVANAVWNADKDSHTTADTFGKYVYDIYVDTNDLETDIGTNGAGLTAIPWNASWDAEVTQVLESYGTVKTSELMAVSGVVISRTLLAGSYFDNTADSVIVGSVSTGAITAGAIAADAIGASEFSQAAADKVWDTTSRILTASTNFNDLSGGEIAVDVWGYAARSLTNLGGVAISGDVARAVWNAATATYGGTGTYAQVVEDILYDTTTTLNDKIDTIDANVDTLIVGVNVSQVNGASVSLLAASGIADAVWDEPQSSHTVAGTAGVQMWTDIDAILVDTNEVQGDLNSLIIDIGSNGTGLTAIPWNSAWGAEVQNGVTTSLTSYNAATEADILGLNDISASDVWSASARSLSSAIKDFDSLVASGVNVVAINGVDVTTYTDKEIAGAVWEEVVVDHDTTGTMGHALVVASGNLISGNWGDATSTTQSTIITHLNDIKGTSFAKDTHSLTNIEAYVDGLPSDPADASVIAAAFSSLEAHGDSTWNTAIGFSTSADIIAVSGNIANLVWNELKSAHTTPNTFGDYLDDEISSRAALGEPLTSSEVSAAVWNATLSSYDSAGSTGQALVTASGNLIGGGSVLTSSDIADAVWDEVIADHLGGDKAGQWAVWGSGLNWNMTYDAADQALSDYNVAKGSEVATAAQIWSYPVANLITPNTTGITLGLLASGVINSNMVQVSGENVTLADIQTGDIDTTGLATTNQLEYWALMILNTCGGGPVG